VRRLVQVTQPEQDCDRYFNLILEEAMSPAVAAAAIDASGFQGFLVYGPLGLAGLVLVLVVTAMSLRKDVSYSSERILKLVLFAGVFCFISRADRSALHTRSCGGGTA
jgi:hypothetical protein